MNPEKLANRKLTEDLFSPAKNTRFRKVMACI